MSFANCFSSELTKNEECRPEDLRGNRDCNNPDESAAMVIGRSRGVEALVDLLNLQASANIQEAVLTEEQVMKLNFIDKEGNSLLHKAVERREYEVMDMLIHWGIDVNRKNPKTKLAAIDIAWENSDYESMLLLLNADSFFPQNFTINGIFEDTEIPERLKLLVQMREDLHKWLKVNDLEKIKCAVSNVKLSKFLSGNNESALESAAKFGSVSTMAALLGFESHVPGHEVHLTDKQLKLLNNINADGNSLLSIASQNGKQDIVKFLISLKFNTNHRNREEKTPVDLAWENRYYNIVLQLLESDSDVPSDFDVECLSEDCESQRNLKLFLQGRDDLHESIKGGCIENVKEYVSNCKKSKLYLNSKGTSAALTAIKNKQFKVYAFMKLFGANFKNENEKSIIDENLSPDEKDLLKKSMIPYFYSVSQSSILYLLSKSKPHKYVDQFENKIRVLYEKLSCVPQVLKLLQIVQYTDYLEIIFDFDNENIKEINPTASGSTRGTTDYKEGRLYIAGKMDETKILGTIAHELSHLAMQILYNNNCNPYRSNDSETEGRFRKIGELVKNMDDIQERIGVFKGSSETEEDPMSILSRAYRYPEHEQHSELIVRVPHILAQFGKEGERWFNLGQIHPIKKLYDYYDNVVIPDSNKFIEESFLIKPRNIVRILNQSIGDINNIRNINVYFKQSVDPLLFSDTEKQLFAFSSKNTWLTLLNIYQGLLKIPMYSFHDNYIILKYNNYLKNSVEVNKAFYLEASNLLIIECTNDVALNSLTIHLKEWADLLRGKNEKRIILVIHEDRMSDFVNALSETGVSGECQINSGKNFTLYDFTRDSQDALLDRTIVFQGVPIPLCSLIDVTKESRKLIEGETLLKLINGEKIDIGSDMPCSSGYDKDYYIDRIFNLKIKINSRLLQNEEELVAYNEEQFVHLCQDNPKSNVHWLTKELIWLKSQGSIEALIKCRVEDQQHFSKEENQGYLCLEDDMAKLNYWNKIIVISDTPGMGKSTVLTSLSKKMKNENKNSWVVRVDLNRHTNAFHSEIIRRKRICSSFEENNKPVDFLLTEILKYNSEGKDEECLNRKCLEYELKHKKSVILLFDGFDEISPDYKGIVIDFIRGLLPRVKTLWITTRPYLRAEIERNLGIFAYTLNPLSTEEQVAFLTKFWQKCNPNLKNKERVVAYGSALIRMLSQSISDREKKFTGVPLQLRMIAEVFLKKQEISGLLDEILEDMEEQIKPIKEGLQEFYFSTNETPYFSEKIDLMSLYKLFIYKKYCDIYEREKKMSVLTNLPTKKDIKKSYPVFIEEHAMLSLYTVFSADECEILLTRRQRRTVSSLMEDVSSGEEKKGIIHGINGSRPHFIHLTFAHYFASNFLASLFSDNAPDDEVQDFFFREILLKADYQGIRLFLSGHLENKKPPQNILKACGRKLKDLWELEGLSDGDKTVLHVSAKEGNTSIVNLLLNSLCSYHPATCKAVIGAEDSSRQTPLELAAFFDNLEVVKALVEKGVDIDTKNKHGETVLHLAVTHGYRDMVEWLVRERAKGGGGSDVNARDHNNDTALHAGVDKGNLDIVKLLVNHGSSVNARNCENYSVLHNAVHSQIALEIITVLIENGVDIHVKDEDGNSVLHYAAYNGKLDVAKLLYECEADVYEKAMDGSTLLHEAAISDNKEFCRWLINDHKLDVNARDDNGRTPLHEAVEKDNLEIVKLLIEYNSNVYAEDVNGNTVLLEGAKYGSPKLFEWLIKNYNFCLSMTNKVGRTILHESAKYSNIDLVEWLLEKGLDPSLEDLNGNVVITEVTKHEMLYSPGGSRVIKFKDVPWKKWKLENNAYIKTGQIYNSYDTDIAVIQCLIRFGASVNASDRNGRTVLHYAAERNQLDIVRWLITPKENGGGGADIALSDINQDTAFDLATKVGDKDMIELIKSFSTQNHAPNGIKSYGLMA